MTLTNKNDKPWFPVDFPNETNHPSRASRQDPDDPKMWVSSRLVACEVGDRTYCTIGCVSKGLMGI